MKINDRKPILFEKSDHNIWTDPYIQQQMLKKHLDLHSDEASRRQEYIVKIVNFILNTRNRKAVHLIWGVDRDCTRRSLQMKCTP